MKTGTDTSNTSDTRKTRESTPASERFNQVLELLLGFESDVRAPITDQTANVAYTIVLFDHDDESTWSIAKRPGNEVVFKAMKVAGHDRNVIAIMLKLHNELKRLNDRCARLGATQGRLAEIEIKSKEFKAKSKEFRKIILRLRAKELISKEISELILDLCK